MKLSPRMKTFLDHSLKERPLWDICCDHGYVGLGALKDGHFSEVHFVDQVPHIMKKLEDVIKEGESFETPYFIHCLPAENLSEKILGTFLVAGVGGLTIKNIMEPLLKKELMQCERLLFSPQTDEKVLIEFLASDILTSAYDLKEKISIPEGKRIRSLYVLNLKPR